MSLEDLNEEFKEFLASKAKKDVSPSPIPGLVMYQDGRIKATSLVNVEKLLTHDFGSAIKFNDFTQDIENTSLIKLDDYSFYIKKIDDDFFNQLRSYFDSHYGTLFASDLIYTAVSNVAHRNRFNPVEDYFNEAHKLWDKQDRFSTIFHDFLGVNKSELTTEITKMWMTAAVAKTFEDEFQFDYVLDFIGDQGVGKTTFLKRIGFGYTTDKVMDFTNKDYYSMMIKSLILNDDEMKATKKASFEELKSFVTMTDLEFRPPYGRTVNVYPKHFVIARTTNEKTYLKDKTGDRRFVPLHTHADQAKFHPSELTAKTKEYIQQTWGQAMDTYRKYTEGEYEFKLSSDLEDQLGMLRQSVVYVDETEEQLDEALERSTNNFITTKDIAINMGEYDLLKNDRLAKKIKYYMDNKDDWVYKVKKIDGIAKRGYTRKSNV
ncbi:VapE domain-containing protein [Oenococcus sicerae]|uniref:Helicase n=1 Tax=Oenococcus sicerae TaxID=2203724 RepID=A0AAJ1R7I3_9LACO|nr:VapE domain-containing protein [Oenococcus sicerae]MDN6899549.1 helicase [Oenococcus sicerae]